VRHHIHMCPRKGDEKKQSWQELVGNTRRRSVTAFVSNGLPYQIAADEYNYPKATEEKDDRWTQKRNAEKRDREWIEEEKLRPEIPTKPVARHVSLQNHKEIHSQHVRP